MNREERSKYLGGTDVSHIFNLPKYYCARKLWYDKKLQPEDYPEDREGLFALGHALEPECWRRYLDLAGRDVNLTEYSGGNRGDDAPDWLHGHPDRLINHPRRRRLGVGESKTFSGNAWNQMVWAEGIPKAYLLQLQTYLWQTGLPWAAWACLNRETGQFLAFDVDRDEKITGDIRYMADAWWKAYMTNDPVFRAPEPPPGWRDRCHDDKAPCGHCVYRHACLGGKQRAAVEDLAEERRLRGDLPASADERLGRLLARRDGLKGPRDRANRAWDAINNAIKARLAFLDAPDGVCLNGRRVTAAEQIRCSWDEDGMQAAGVDVARFKIPGAASRSLKVGKEK